MRCALVHDWLTGMRGGEKVLEVLCEIFPCADLYTLIHVPGSVSPVIENRRIIASCLNSLPAIGRHYRNLLPLMPWAAGRMRLEGYDLVVAVSHCVAHGVRVAEGQRFVCYYLTPMRYAWDMLDAYFVRRKRFAFKYHLLRGLQPRLQDWDRRAAGRVAECLSDCENVRRRVERCYGRSSTVIYPPVDTDYYQPLDIAPEGPYLWVGALAPYKRMDLALEAFRGLDRELLVIGEGQDLDWARRMAPPNVRFLGRQPNEVLREHYASCRALIFPGEEDFGIVPVEVQACGRPVIAYGRGGALETVVDLATAGLAGGATGVLFHEPAAESLRAAIGRFEQSEGAFCREAMRRNALRFSRERCKAAFRDYLLAPQKGAERC
jgi:glycosyltransferase involved in cell wall biosynthesis